MGKLHSEKVLRSMSLCCTSGKRHRMQVEMLRPGHSTVTHETKKKKSLPVFFSFFFNTLFTLLS